MSDCKYCSKPSKTTCSKCGQAICDEHQTSLGGKILCTRCLKRYLMMILAPLVVIIMIVILVVIFL